RRGGGKAGWGGRGVKDAKRGLWAGGVEGVRAETFLEEYRARGLWTRASISGRLRRWRADSHGAGRMWPSPLLRFVRSRNRGNIAGGIRRSGTSSPRNPRGAPHPPRGGPSVPSTRSDPPP